MVLSTLNPGPTAYETNLICCLLRMNSAQPQRMQGEWPSGLYSLRQVTEVKLGRVRSDFGWVTSEA